jgi:hypothetical protein
MRLAGWRESLKRRKVVMAMEGDKVPGPDGFFIAFFQVFWEVVKESFLHKIRS